jgi:hypothetical protein
LKSEAIVAAREFALLMTGTGQKRQQRLRRSPVYVRGTLKADVNSSFASPADGLLTNHRIPSRRYHEVTAVAIVI